MQIRAAVLYRNPNPDMKIIILVNMDVKLLSCRSYPLVKVRGLSPLLRFEPPAIV